MESFFQIILMTLTPVVLQWLTSTISSALLHSFQTLLYLDRLTVDLKAVLPHSPCVYFEVPTWLAQPECGSCGDNLDDIVKWSTLLL